MKKIIWIAVLCLPLIGCNAPNYPQLLQYAQFGIDAVCNFGAEGLPKDVCTFGTDALAAANAAIAKDPDKGLLAAQQILADAAAKKPELAPHFAWLLKLKT